MNLLIAYFSYYVISLSLFLLILYNFLLKPKKLFKKIICISSFYDSRSKWSKKYFSFTFYAAILYSCVLVTHQNIFHFSLKKI